MVAAIFKKALVQGRSPRRDAAAFVLCCGRAGGRTAANGAASELAGAAKMIPPLFLILSLLSW